MMIEFDQNEQQFKNSTNEYTPWQLIQRKSKIFCTLFCFSIIRVKIYHQPK